MTTAPLITIVVIVVVVINIQRAEVLGREDELRLLKNRQLALLVDLDQTLLHTTNDNIPPNLKVCFIAFKFILRTQLNVVITYCASIVLC